MLKRKHLTVCFILNHSRGLRVRYPGLIHSITPGQTLLSTTVGVGDGYSPGSGGNIRERIGTTEGGGRCNSGKPSGHPSKIQSKRLHTQECEGESLISPTAHIPSQEGWTWGRAGSALRRFFKPTPSPGYISHKGSGYGVCSSGRSFRGISTQGVSGGVRKLAAVQCPYNRGRLLRPHTIQRRMGRWFTGLNITQSTSFWGSLKQGPELELACHNSLYGSLANLIVLTGVPVWSSGIYLLNTTYGHRFSLLQFAINIHLSHRLL